MALSTWSKDLWPHDVGGGVRLRADSDVAGVADPTHGNIQLSVTEDIVVQVEAHTIVCLTLAFVDGAGKSWTNWELTASERGTGCAGLRVDL